jgi:hypothetical protein
MSFEEFRDKRVAWQMIIDEKCNLRIGLVHNAPTGPIDFCKIAEMFKYE